MNRLVQRIERLEFQAPSSSERPTVVNVFVAPGTMAKRIGRIKAPWGTFIREPDEPEDGFVMRAYAARPVSGRPEEMSDDDLTYFLAGRLPAFARALVDGKDITDEMLERALAGIAA